MVSAEMSQPFWLCEILKKNLWKKLMLPSGGDAGEDTQTGTGVCGNVANKIGCFDHFLHIVHVFSQYCK